MSYQSSIKTVFEVQISSIGDCDGCLANFDQEAMNELADMIRRTISSEDEVKVVVAPISVVYENTDGHRTEILMK